MFLCYITHLDMDYNVVNLVDRGLQSNQKDVEAIMRVVVRGRIDYTFTGACSGNFPRNTAMKKEKNGCVENGGWATVRKQVTRYSTARQSVSKL